VHHHTRLQRKGKANGANDANGEHTLVLKSNLVNHVCDKCSRPANAHRAKISANASDNVNWQAYRWYAASDVLLPLQLQYFQRFVAVAAAALQRFVVAVAAAALPCFVVAVAACFASAVLPSVLSLLLLMLAVTVHLNLLAEFPSLIPHCFWFVFLTTPPHLTLFDQRHLLTVTFVTTTSAVVAMMLGRPYARASPTL
jgi:hypothetical protein